MSVVCCGTNKYKFYCSTVHKKSFNFNFSINTVKKLLRRRVRDVELLKRRLDKHNDIWRQLPMVAPHPKRKIEQKRGPKPKPKNPTDEPTEGKVKKVRKQRMKKNLTPQTNNVEGSMLPLHFSDHQEKQLVLQQQFVQYKQDI